MVVVEVVVEVVEVVASCGSVDLEFYLINNSTMIDKPGQMISFLNFNSITSGFWPLKKNKGCWRRMFLIVLKNCMFLYVPNPFLKYLQLS